MYLCTLLCRCIRVHVCVFIRTSLFVYMLDTYVSVFVYTCLYMCNDKERKQGDKYGKGEGLYRTGVRLDHL